MTDRYTLANLSRDHDIELETLPQRVAEREPELVGLQMPDGIRDYAPAIADWLTEQTGVECVISGEPSFGACDLDLDLERLGVDLLVHFGHSPMPSLGSIDAFEVLFVPTFSKAPIEGVVREAGKQLAGRTVGILTTAQHATRIDEMRAILEEEGCQTRVGFGDNRVINPGQLLGCNFTAARTVADEIECFLYVGSGDFHPIAAAWGMDLPVFVADPMKDEVRQVDDRIEALMRQRHATIASAQEAESFGILVGTRVGQMRMKYARGLANLCRRHGKSAYVISLDYFTPDALASFRHLGAWVNTGCPRITTDDYARYDNPMLTPQELEIVLGKRDWSDYIFDEFKGTEPAPHHHEDAVELDSPVLGE